MTHDTHLSPRQPQTSSPQLHTHCSGKLELLCPSGGKNSIAVSACYDGRHTLSLFSLPSFRAQITRRRRVLCDPLRSAQIIIIPIESASANEPAKRFVLFRYTLDANTRIYFVGRAPV